LVSMFIRDDFPTLLLPINAYSGMVFFGHLETSELLITNSADFISIDHFPKKECVFKGFKTLFWLTSYLKSH